MGGGSGDRSRPPPAGEGHAAGLARTGGAALGRVRVLPEGGPTQEAGDPVRPGCWAPRQLGPPTSLHRGSQDVCLRRRLPPGLGAGEGPAPGLPLLLVPGEEKEGVRARPSGPGPACGVFPSLARAWGPPPLLLALLWGRLQKCWIFRGLRGRFGSRVCCLPGAREHRGCGEVLVSGCPTRAGELCARLAHAVCVLRVRGELREPGPVSRLLSRRPAWDGDRQACGRPGVGPATPVPAWCPVPLSQAEVCSGTVADVLQSVVSGADGCIFSFGHTSLGKRPPIFPVRSLWASFCRKDGGNGLSHAGSGWAQDRGWGHVERKPPAVLGGRGTLVSVSPGRTWEAAGRGWALRACQGECRDLTRPCAPQASPTP